MDEIVEGGILAFLVLLLFLQELRTPLIIGVVFPVSIVATFNLLYFGGITLNIMSLGGLALGVGMLDDCAVVVSENIFRHKSLGKSPAEAAEVGASEVGMAVTATALTTIVVFLPVIYVHGIAGPLFRDAALTVTFSLLSSLVVSLTLLPMLAGRGLANGGGGVGGGQIHHFKMESRPGRPSDDRYVFGACPELRSKGSVRPSASSRISSSSLRCSPKRPSAFRSGRS